ncbi:RNA polymerase sigma factor RpoD/SigA [Fibrobacterota bacterium]
MSKMNIYDNSESTLRYLKDIRKTSPNSRKSEHELFRLCRKGNAKARAKLISGNMRFVLKVALQYRGCPIPLSDLVSIGAIGLVTAIEKFDHTRGLKFISYAVWWIKAYITKALNEEGSLIRLPANQHLKVRRALSSGHKDEINDEIRELIRITQKGHSFDSPLKEDSKTTFAEVIADNSADRADMKAEIKATENFIRNLLAEVPEREAKILSELFGLGFEKPRTLREVGEGLNISHERVRQLRDQALRRLKNCKFKEILREKMEAQIETAS